MAAKSVEDSFFTWKQNEIPQARDHHSLLQGSHCKFQGTKRARPSSSPEFLERPLNCLLLFHGPPHRFAFASQKKCVEYSEQEREWSHQGTSLCPLGAWGCEIHAQQGTGYCLCTSTLPAHTGLATEGGWNLQVPWTMENILLRATGQAKGIGVRGMLKVPLRKLWTRPHPVFLDPEASSMLETHLKERKTKQQTQN